PGIREKVIFLPGPEIGINSTDIRQRIKEGRSIRYLVLPEVEVYIKRHGLYA
ncbi:MAG: nicotinic acid mononucleotide adenylyltransferase, partial [Dehalococcoidia bacterium]|nr:nicotinic acid mononucleotide adenylyltransferase [Dehalococcoidia bacterium]